MGLIYIVRHGNTFDKGDIVRRVGGRTDLPLSSSGQAQASRLAQHFSHIDFAYIYASMLKRQYQTAQAIVKMQKSVTQIEPLEALREIDYGQDENKPESDVIARNGAMAMADWDLHGKPPSGWHIDPKRIQKDWIDFFNAAQPQAKPILAVTSNGIARFIFDVADADKNTPRKLRTGAYGLIKIGVNQNDKPQIISWDIRPD